MLSTAVEVDRWRWQGFGSCGNTFRLCTDSVRVLLVLYSSCLLQRPTFVASLVRTCNPHLTRSASKGKGEVLMLTRDSDLGKITGFLGEVCRRQRERVSSRCFPVSFLVCYRSAASCPRPKDLCLRCALNLASLAFLSTPVRHELSGRNGTVWSMFDPLAPCCTVSISVPKPF